MSARRVLFQLFVVIVCCAVFFFARKNTARMRERKMYEGMRERFKNASDPNVLSRPLMKIATDDIRTKMTLEYPNLCYTIQIFYMATPTKFDNRQSEIKKAMVINRIDNGAISSDNHNGLTLEYLDEQHHMELKKQQQRNQPQPHKKVDNIHGSNTIIYVFMLFLILSLIRAALDISKHFNKNDKDKDDFSRRTSLQEFAQSRHSRKNSKKKPMSRQESTITPGGSPIFPENSIISNLFDNSSQFLLNKIAFGSTASKISAANSLPTAKPHIANIITNNSSIPDRSEPGSPAKMPTKLLGGRPAPMMRRQSVPCAVGQSIFSNTYGGLARRPSMDSFSEGDSSPDVKRRVRMIHRH